MHIVVPLLLIRPSRSWRGVRAMVALCPNVETQRTTALPSRAESVTTMDNAQAAPQGGDLFLAHTRAHVYARRTDAGRAALYLAFGPQVAQFGRIPLRLGAPGFSAPISRVPLSAPGYEITSQDHVYAPGGIMRY
jgi:hypothetical protein